VGAGGAVEIEVGLAAVVLEGGAGGAGRQQEEGRRRQLALLGGGGFGGVAGVWGRGGQRALRGEVAEEGGRARVRVRAG